MDVQELIIRLRAGLACGRTSTCGRKERFVQETAANLVASTLSKKINKKLEAYPCIFCGYWHIGNKIDIIELSKLADKLDNML